MRWRSDRVTGSAVPEPVADAGHGVDHRRVTQLAAQRHHGDPYGVRERVRVCVPGLLEQLLGRYDLSFGTHQDGEDGELLGREREHGSVPGHRVPRDVEDDAALVE